MSQLEGCFLPAQVRMRNDLPYTVFDIGALIGWVKDNSLPLVADLSSVFAVFPGAGSCGVTKAIY